MYLFSNYSGRAVTRLLIANLPSSCFESKTVHYPDLKKLYSPKRVQRFLEHNFYSEAIM